MKIVCVTGCAGFIGYHICKRLLADDYCVLGIDNFDAYYQPGLKKDRLNMLIPNSNFTFFEFDLLDENSFFLKCQFDCIIHLAAQPGVGKSITHPHEYLQNNVETFFNVLEACAAQHKTHPIKLLYASSSSVYGDNDQSACREFMNTDMPLSFYAATKKTNELMAYSYSHLYGFPSIGMRFFTVYGPWGRPDMAYWKFANAISNGETITLHNGGQVSRDFTYIDDIVDGIILLMESPMLSHSHEIYNIGSQQPHEVIELLSLIEENLCRRASAIISVPLPAGMAKRTCADNWKLHTATGYVAKTSLAEGVKNFVEWYQRYNRPVIGG